MTALAALALGDGVGGAGVPRPSALADAIARQGGQVLLPYGHGRCLVAREGDAVVGMIYATPPIRWLEGQPAVRRASLVGALVEIELLAVDAGFRGRGVGTALIEAAETAAREEGARLALAKVRVGEFSTMRWYRKRGYTIAGQGEPVLFHTRSGPSSCGDGGDGYQLAVKTLLPGTVIRRRTAGGIPVLTAEHDV